MSAETLLAPWKGVREGLLEHFGVVGERVTGRRVGDSGLCMVCQWKRCQTQE